MRELARVVRIDEIRPIEGADAIDAARVGGWTVVVKKGEFTAGDRAVYFEIDSFLPQGNPAWQFLVDKSARDYEGLRGHVLRTVRLRGQLSQGLLLPFTATLAEYAKDFDANDEPVWVDPQTFFQDGENVTDVLGVLKYEPPIPAELAGEVIGLFPSRVPKTDQERIQNLALELQGWQGEALEWEVTEKLEGASSTWAWLDGELHVCSRNLDLRETEGNTHWRVARENDIEARLRSVVGTRNLALQGELVGNGIQDNIYRLQGHRFYLYDIYDVDQGRYLRPKERKELAAQLGLLHVPVVNPSFVIDSNVGMDELLAMADGDSALRAGQAREGLVFKARGKEVSFKAISNRYLLKQKG